MQGKNLQEEAGLLQRSRKHGRGSQGPNDKEMLTVALIRIGGGLKVLVALQCPKTRDLFS